MAYTRDDHGISLHRRFRETMDVKLALNLVCRNWHGMNTEFLFRYLLIRGGEHAVRIAAALERHEPASETSRGPGWWTVRLDLALEGTHMWKNRHSRALASIFRNCPNLVTFSSVFCTTSPQFLRVPAFAQAFSELASLQGLRRLELSGKIEFFDTVVPLVSAYLEVLWLRPSPCDADIRRPMQQCRFPKLHTLILSSGTQANLTGPLDVPSFATVAPNLLACWKVPSLETFIVHDVAPAELPQALGRFLERNGEHLRCLTVSGWFREFVYLCPNITDYEVPSDAAVPFSRDDMHPSICRLTLTGQHNMFNLLTAVASGAFPSLEVVRVLLPVQRRDLLAEAFMLECKRRNIRVEVSTGGDEHSADVWHCEGASGDVL